MEGVKLASNIFLCIFVMAKRNVRQSLIFKLFTLVSNPCFVWKALQTGSFKWSFLMSFKILLPLAKVKFLKSFINYRLF